MTTRAATAGSLLEEQPFRRLLLWSLGGHIVLGLALVITPPSFSGPLPLDPVYVEVLPKAGSAPAPAPAPQKQTVEEAVVIPPTPKPTPKPPPPKPEAKPKPAPPKPEPKKKVEPTPQPQTEAKDKPEVKASDIISNIRKKRGEDAGAGGDPGAKGVVAGIFDRARAAYDKKIRDLIYGNWLFQGSSLNQARFEVEVAANGTLVEIKLTHSSGDRFLDESAERAIRRSDPFPPPPSGYNLIPIVFDPSQKL